MKHSRQQGRPRDAPPTSRTPTITTTTTAGDRDARECREDWRGHHAPRQLVPSADDSGRSARPFQLCRALRDESRRPELCRATLAVPAGSGAVACACG